ncbi:MAG: SDR family NAD(P)-dependent oxidoreductase [Candidatus Nanoarchaeia archaeon]|jgi:NAD(P)-dependent dehydrogenase (short-subunit alcohol dehydrogenase family)
MNRLEQIIRSENLSGKRIIVTGVGYKPVNRVFNDLITNEPCHDEIIIDDIPYKINIGAATAAVLAQNGAIVHMVSRTKNKLEDIKNALSEFIDPAKLEYSAVDVLDNNSVKEFVDSLAKDKPIYWCQSIGLGAGAYKVPDDCPYLKLEDIPFELIENEARIVLLGTHTLMQNLLPVFKKQNKEFNTETRVAIITSMSAIRSYPFGGTHCPAKGAISRYANAAMLELWKEKIYVSDVRPGMVDTGFYDNQKVIENHYEISDAFNGIHREHFVVAPPISVAEGVAYVLSTSAHITSFNLVARGQFPNEGS